MQNCSIGGCDELNTGKLPIGTFGPVTLTHEGPTIITMNQCAKSKQEENTIHLSIDLEDYSCIISNAPTKLDRHQGIIKMCGFVIPIWHNND
jgi:hypothetical protein